MQTKIAVKTADINAQPKGQAMQHKEDAKPYAVKTGTILKSYQIHKIQTRDSFKYYRQKDGAAACNIIQGQ